MLPVQKRKNDDEYRTHVMIWWWWVGCRTVAVSNVLDDKPLCYSSSLLIPPLEPLHAGSEVLDIIKSHLDEVVFRDNGHDMINNLHEESEGHHTMQLHVLDS